MWKIKIWTKLLLALLVTIVAVEALVDRARDNGDIYIVSHYTFDGDIDDISTTTPKPADPDYIDFDEITHICNASFITPISNVLTFNSTGSLPDDNDTTSMCYFRCFFEKSGLMDNFKLNAELVRKYVWPATGDSIEYCESQGKETETNGCIRGFAIVKCVMLRALTDARNKPTV
ncbi:general odorant-binding protein 84a [Scaptodrosophila lebanonensis]|uniref:General odorant-binding protein 84a n=1 Tax=Drosophila lebanonensis TaxID=7225 RepID=A0A6J2TFP6_DROLE|nr:general odorant-binding protein 84a [Scaptodrosophila lebanonensis]